MFSHAYSCTILTMASANNRTAKAGLNRYLDLKSKEAGVLESNPNLRPKYVQLVKSVPQADKWRSVVLSEISVKLGRINDPSVGILQIRDLNDDLNKLYKEKRAWEYHIRDIGGPDYITQRTEIQGLDINGYRYFGRARDLPDAKEIIEQREQEKLDRSNKQTQEALLKKKDKEQASRINNGDYYGLYEESRVSEDLSVIDAQITNITGLDMGFDSSVEPGSNKLLEYEKEKSSKLLAAQVKAERGTPDGYVEIGHIPSEEEITQWLVDRRKQELLARLKENRA